MGEDHDSRQEDRQEDRQFETKMDAFVRAHQRIVDDFGHSLANSRHFLKLAGRSIEKEPLETETMLEQIKEIDLLGHLNGQYDEYRNIAGFMLPLNSPVDNLALQGNVAELQTKYEALLEEAEGQMESIDTLLTTLQTRH